MEREIFRDSFWVIATEKFTKKLPTSAEENATLFNYLAVAPSGLTQIAPNLRKGSGSKRLPKFWHSLVSPKREFFL
ncbi:MAG TPA: hypothetical protein DDZ80_22485 [Cyanobacteria bacterium UBA8803]|nr:hypothetical protein [Cyanobacteria bacterium UBA8803]